MFLVGLKMLFGELDIVLLCKFGDLTFWCC